MKTLFSRNRITLIKWENKEPSNESFVSKTSGVIFSTLGDDNNRYIKKETKVITEHINTKCKSPLGFYYYKLVEVEQVVKNDKKYNPTVSICEIIMTTKHNTYKLQYPVAQNGISISVDTRPWMIVEGCKSMPDHFITDLYNDLESIFQELQSEKASVNSYEGSYVSTSNGFFKKTKQGLGEFKNSLYLNLFGNSKGPRNMTNDEKILAHGFDLKTSFRKDKTNESK